MLYHNFSVRLSIELKNFLFKILNHEGMHQTRSEIDMRKGSNVVAYGILCRDPKDPFQESPLPRRVDTIRHYYNVKVNKYGIK